MVTRIRALAPIPRPVLIVGERGTGKELVARAIHFAAPRTSRAIVAVSSASFSDALLESELLGHERGAFTGADAMRHGKFAQADGGTLFLDEIGHMSLPFQRKILRVVEYGTYTRVGGHQELTTTARIVAATNVIERAGPVAIRRKRSRRTIWACLPTHRSAQEHERLFSVSRRFAVNCSTRH